MVLSGIEVGFKMAYGEDCFARQRIMLWLEDKDLSVSNLNVMFSDGTEMAKLVNKLWPRSLTERNFKKCYHVNAKQGNWHKINEVLKKYGFSLTEKEIYAIASGTLGGIESLLEKIMTKDLKEAPEYGDSEDIVNEDKIEEAILGNSLSDDELAKPFDPSEQRVIYELSKELNID